LLMAMMDFYQLFGQLIFMAIMGLVMLLLVSLFLGRILLSNSRVVFPRLLFLTLDLFYGPFKRFASIFGLSESIVDQIGVEVRNRVNEEKFNNIPAEDKLLVLSHCLRHLKCEAPLEPSGLKCKNCKKMRHWHAKRKSRKDRLPRIH